MQVKLPFILLALCGFNSIAQNSFRSDTNPQRPNDFEYLSSPDTSGKRAFLKMPSRKLLTQQLKLPYPIIFIHGLWSDCFTWNTTTNFMDSQYLLSYGGRFDFCLNYDLDYTTSNKNFYPTVGADIAAWTPASGIFAADYYYVNFDVGSDGSFSPSSSSPINVKSNQSAIAKQGIALRNAINEVLQVTGRDKVVLMGHSMGGLAAREYLQNSYNWQPDGQHHVAKLVTTGTPHGGSNVTTAGILYGPDGQSEAIRDLRTSYAYSGNFGVYLFGGIENLPFMEDQLLYYFYNSDVNCNGVGGTSQSIIGLNQKSIDTNIAYSCIVGDCSSCPVGPGIPGDGVVKSFSADLHNYEPSINTDIYDYNASALYEIHTDMPSKYYQNMQGLDEPNEYYQSYSINFSTPYIGFTTIQPVGGYPYDYDDYVFSVTGNTSVSINVSNITLADYMVRVKDLNYNTIGTVVHSNGSSSINLIRVLTTGSYYLEIYAIPTTTSYLYPYTFSLSNVTMVPQLADMRQISVYPNPTGDKLYFRNLSNNCETIIAIENVLGEKVLETELLNNELSVKGLAPALYFAKIKTQQGFLNVKFLKE